jgi:hypothetical protein
MAFVDVSIQQDQDLANLTWINEFDFTTMGKFFRLHEGCPRVEFERSLEEKPAAVCYGLAAVGVAANGAITIEALSARLTASA